MPDKQNGLNEQWVSMKTFVGPLSSNFVGIEDVQTVDIARCSKNVFWKDCFRWTEGPAETIQYARGNKNTVRNTQMRSNDAWLG